MKCIFAVNLALSAIAPTFPIMMTSQMLQACGNGIFSFLFSALAFGGITLGMGNLGTYGILSIHVVPALFIGIISGIIFVHRQLHQEEPFWELRKLKNKNYTLIVVGSMLLYLVMMGSSILMPIYSSPY